MEIDMKEDGKMMKRMAKVQFIITYRNLLLC